MAADIWEWLIKKLIEVIAGRIYWRGTTVRRTESHEKTPPMDRPHEFAKQHRGKAH